MTDADDITQMIDDCEQRQSKRLMMELEAALKLCRSAANHIEKVAFDIPAPNRHTPELMSCAALIRYSAGKIESGAFYAEICVQELE